MTENNRSIRFASFLGENAYTFYRNVVEYLAETSGVPTEMLADASAGLDAMFSGRQIEAAFGCGLPYVWKASEPSPTVQLLAAPVMPAERYQNQPIYFSDVIIRADSPWRRFEDLRGKTFAFNQAISFSGYVIMRYHLLTLNDSDGFFGTWVESGSHANSMDWVEQGKADVATIDSVVFDMELAQRPERRQMFRVVASLGPAAMPPIMVSTRVAPEARQRLQQALTNMHNTQRGAEILKQGAVGRFAAVADSNYDSIRAMLQALEQSPSR